MNTSNDNGKEGVREKDNMGATSTSTSTSANNNIKNSSGTTTTTNATSISTTSASKAAAPVPAVSTSTSTSTPTSTLTLTPTLTSKPAKIKTITVKPITAKTTTSKPIQAHNARRSSHKSIMSASLAASLASLDTATDTAAATDEALDKSDRSLASQSIKSIKSSATSISRSVSVRKRRGSGQHQHQQHHQQQQQQQQEHQHHHQHHHHHHHQQQQQSLSTNNTVVSNSSYTTAYHLQNLIPPNSSSSATMERTSTIPSSYPAATAMNLNLNPNHNHNNAHNTNTNTHMMMMKQGQQQQHQQKEEEYPSSLDSLHSYHYPKKHKIPNPRKPISSCPLVCVFYAEFDIIVGPKISFQSPMSFMDCDIDISLDDIDILLKNAFHKEQQQNQQQKNQQQQNQQQRSDDNSEGSNNDNDTNHGDGDGDGSINDDGNDNDNNNGNTETNEKSNIDHLQSSQQPPNSQQQQDTPSSSSSPSYSIFDSTSEYIITGDEMLAGKIISLSTHNMHILSFPIIIQNTQRYERNSLLFSVGFVIRRLFDPSPFRPLLSKLANTFQSMELESAFLSNDSTRCRLQQILDGVLHSLNSPSSECHLLLDDANILHLQYFPPPKVQGPPVPDYVVPVLLRPESQLQSLDWDLTINWIVPHINGIKYVKLIAESSKVDIEMVRACLRVLRHHHAVACVDIFRYDNIYVCTAKAQRMLAGGDEELENLLQEAYNFVSKHSLSSPSSTNHMHIHHQNGTGSGNGSSSVRGSFSLGSGSNVTTSLAGSAGMSKQQYLPHLTPFGTNHGGGTLSNSPTGGGTGTIGSPGCTPSSSYTPTTPTPTLIIPPLSSSYNIGTTSLHHPNNNSLSTKRREPNSLMKALAILYVSCQRDVTLGDVWINKLVGCKKSRTESTDASDTTTTNHRDGKQYNNVENEKKYSKFRSSSFGSSSSVGGEGLLKEVDVDWKDVFELFDHIRFVTFGVIHGLIQRLHEYPIAYDIVTEEEDDDSTSFSAHDDIIIQVKEDDIRQSHSKDNRDFRSSNYNFRFSPTMQPQHAPSIPTLPSLNYIQHASTTSSQGRYRDESKAERERERELALKIASHMDGQRCDDELSCMFQRPLSDLKDLVTKKAKKEVISIFQ